MKVLHFLAVVQALFALLLPPLFLPPHPAEAEGSAQPQLRVCVWLAEGRRDNIFGGLKAGNKKALPNKD